MEEVLTNPSVVRVTALLKELGCTGEVTILSDSARTALDAANALGIEVGQVASSIVFKLPNGNPLLVITSGRHRVDTELVAKNLGVEKLHRADADFVKNASGFSIGGAKSIRRSRSREVAGLVTSARAPDQSSYARRRASSPRQVGAILSG